MRVNWFQRAAELAEDVWIFEREAYNWRKEAERWRDLADRAILRQEQIIARKEALIKQIVDGRAFLPSPSIIMENSFKTREMVAQFMLARSIPTGHGDTIEALLGELGSYIDECRKALRETREKAGITT